MVTTERVSFVVRTGEGQPVSDGFSDHVEFASRKPQNRADGTTRVTYGGQTFELRGGKRVPHFICLNRPM